MKKSSQYVYSPIWGYLLIYLTILAMLGAVYVFFVLLDWVSCNAFYYTEAYIPPHDPVCSLTITGAAKDVWTTILELPSIIRGVLQDIGKYLEQLWGNLK